MGWLVALGLVLILSMTPVGASLVYNENGLFLSVLLGAVKIRLYPRTDDKKPEEKKGKATTKKAAPKDAKISNEKKGGKLSDLKPLIDLAIRFLGSFRRKLRVRCLEMNLIMAGDDPCDLALSYGKAWTVVGNLVPLLEKVFVIRKKSVQVQCDFLTDTTRILVRLDLTITVGHLVGLAVKYGALALKEFLKFRKGGAGL